MHNHPSSYRDPSGFVYKQNDLILRQINPCYFDQYHTIKESGIYDLLWDKKWLVRHTEIASTPDHVTIQPEQLSFITFPYEWSFTAYKHAAQLTLRLQIWLLNKGFSLKDASAFNITFNHGKAIFIDTLSIESYRDHEPWKALQQFNEHFLAPLLLTYYYGSDHLKTLQQHIDGIPLHKVAQLLPWRSKLNPTVYSHIHFLGKKVNQTTGSLITDQKYKGLSKSAQITMLQSLESFINKLQIKENTQWSSYYHQTNYNDAAFDFKNQLVSQWSLQINALTVVDLGGNNGTFGRAALHNANQVISCDIDQSAIDDCYLHNIQHKERRLIPIVADLMQPAPSIGFDNQERKSLLERLREYKPDMCMALALIHHITISNNVPFEFSARLFASISDNLIIEFPDRDDSWVQFLLDSKRDAKSLFDHYNKQQFEYDYSKYFTIIQQQHIPNTHRTLYLLKRHEK